MKGLVFDPTVFKGWFGISFNITSDHSNYMNSIFYEKPPRSSFFEKECVDKEALQLVKTLEECFVDFFNKRKIQMEKLLLLRTLNLHFMNSVVCSLNNNIYYRRQVYVMLTHQAWNNFLAIVPIFIRERAFTFLCCIRKICLDLRRLLYRYVLSTLEKDVEDVRDFCNRHCRHELFLRII